MGPSGIARHEMLYLSPVNTLPHHIRIAVSRCIASTALLFSADTTSAPRFSWSRAYSGAGRNVAHP